MSAPKVVSITESGVKRFRDRVAESLANLDRLMTEEVAAINARMRAIEAEVERLKQGGDTPR